MKSHWSNSSSNPNNIDLRVQRREKIVDVLANKPIDRISYIKQIAAGKSVLDVGCVSHYSDSEKASTWLHRHIKESAAECLGIDILESDIKKLNELGYNMIVHNLIESPLESKFDIIICGELIEHLENLGSFLGNCKKCLTDEGAIVVTTPYPWFLGSVIRNVFSRVALPGSLDHVAWHEPSTIMELADRHGFNVKLICGLIPYPEQCGGGFVEHLYTIIRHGYIPFLSKLIGCRSIIYKFELA